MTRDDKLNERLWRVMEGAHAALSKNDKELEKEIEKVTRGDELPPGVVKLSQGLCRQEAQAVGGRQAALSPDGRWLAYVSNESGRDEVYVRPFPNVDGGRWQVSRDGGTEPAWAHSGKELYFRSAGASRGSRSVVAVPVLPGQGFVMGEQKELFQDRYLRDQWHAQYAVTPDDRRFIFVQDVFVGDDGASAPPANMILIQHWLAELDLGRPGGR